MTHECRPAASLSTATSDGVAANGAVSLRVLVLATFVLFACAAPALADGWGDDDPAETTSDVMEDHEAGSENPDDLTVGSHDPDSMTVGSENPDDMVVDSENPDAMLEDAQPLADHEASSEDLSDLQNVRPDAGFEAIDVPGQAQWQPTTDPRILVARRNLIRAEQRAQAARTVYGDMMRRNYPRGEARIRIVEERDASMAALEEAKAALAAVQD